MRPAPAQPAADPGRLAEIIETLTLRAGFNTNTVILGTALLGFAAGVVGVFTLLRKRALVSDAVAHATLPGIAGAFLAATFVGIDPRSLPVLLTGAAASAALSVLVLQLIARSRRLSEDAAIGAVLSVSFAVGIVALSYIQRNEPTGSAGLHALIFGQAAAMRPNDVALMGALCVLVIAVTALLKKELTIVCFNASFARVSGWRVELIDLATLSVVILVTVAGLQAVGLLMIIALLIVPPVAARFWTERMGVLVPLAGAIGALSGYAGAMISALNPRAPAGAVIVLSAGAVFTLSMLAAPKRGLIASVLRGASAKLRYAGDHACEAAVDTGTDTLSASQTSALARERGWHPLFRRILLLILRTKGLATTEPDGSLVLTVAGSERGRRVARNHALWTQYLIEHADVAPTHVDWSVDQVEHVLSGDLIERLERSVALRSQGGTA